MNSLRFRLSAWFSRKVMKPRLRKMQDPVKLRAEFAWLAKTAFLAPPFACYRNGSSGDVPVKYVSCGKPVKPQILFYIHGGGFIAGSPASHQHMIAYLCQKLSVEAVLPQYRLAPEHPFPAAPEDVIAAYTGLVESGVDPGQIILGGDSAGGCLAAVLMAHICKNNLPRPACWFMLSPCLDFTMTSESITSNARSDAILVSERAPDLREMYLADHDPRDPQASPLFAEFPDCPPLLLHVGDHEILRDDTLNFQTKLSGQGSDVLVRSWPTGFHVFQIMLGHFPEAKEALDDIAAFVSKYQTDAEMMR